MQYMYPVLLGLMLALPIGYALADDELFDGLYLRIDTGDLYCAGPDCDPAVPPPVDPPIAVDDIYIFDVLANVCEGVNVLANDISPQNIPLTAFNLPGDGPYHGNLILAADGTCTYQRYPTSDALGDHFGYYATNATEGDSQKAMVHFRWDDEVVVDPCEAEPDLPQCPVDPEPDPCIADPGLPECLPPGQVDWPAITYSPTFPTLGTYSVAGACPTVEDVADAKVTLLDNELLQVAYERLRVLAPTGGGILEIPWDVDINTCDTLRINENKMLAGPLTIQGTVGPAGQIPRFYCRSDTRDGTVERQSVAGEFFAFLGEHDDTTPVVFEQIHVDGYKKAVMGPRKGHLIVRNNYLHHGLSDGIAHSNNETGSGGLELEICGNEISHFGQGNTIHNSYVHRSLGGRGGDTNLDGIPGGGPTGVHNESWNSLMYVDNLCHSSPFSHCLKSTANENHVEGNTFWGTLVTDASYTERIGSTLVDLIACAKNDIINNDFHSYKPEAGKYGDQVIGIRNRRTAVRGCDIPSAWEPYTIPPAAIPGPVHTDAYWTALGGAIQFPTTIEDNNFYIDGEYGWRYYAITMYGTYWNHETTLGSPSCWLASPLTWYERARVYADNNTYWNYDAAYLYRNMPPGHNYYDHCPVESPAGPGPDNDMIEAGVGETIDTTP
jgi:hypothetical protein